MTWPAKLTPDMRVCALKGTNSACRAAEIAAAQAVVFLGQHHDRAAFRRLVGEGGKLGRVGQPLRADIRRGDKLRRLPVAQGDGAGLIQQQGIHVARRFDRAARHGQHVVLHQPIHARDANGGEQAADGRGNQADQQRDQHKDGLRRLRIDGDRLQRGHRQQKDDREPGEQDAEGNFIRRLLPLRAFDQGDHAVQKGLSGIGSDLHHDPVGEHLRSPGHRGAVAARLADHRRGFSGDGRFIHRGHAFDHFSVAGDIKPGLDIDNVAGAQGGTRNLFPGCVFAALFRRMAMVSPLALRSVSAWALPRPSAMASAKLANSTVNHSHKVICRLKAKLP